MEELGNLRKRLYIRIARTKTKQVNVRGFNRNNVKCLTQNVDEILKHILVKDLAKTRDWIGSASI